MTARAPLEELVSITGGGTPNRARADYYNGSIPWVTPKDMKVWSIHRSQETITELGLLESASRLVPSGSVLIVIRSGILKHTLPVAIARRPVAINQDMKALIPNPGLNPEYLARFIQARSLRVLQWVRATTADNFPLDELKALEVPVPSSNEQQRITTQLEMADRLRRMRHYALQMCDEFLPAAFLEMFGDPRQNPHGFPIERLGMLLSHKPSLGTTTPCTTKGKNICIRVGEIGQEEIEYVSCGRVDLPQKDLVRYSVADGDILLARAIGSEDHLGKLSVVNGKHLVSPTVHDSHVMRIRTNKAVLLPIYLSSLLQTHSGRAIFMRQARRTAVQFNINSEQIGGLSFPLPSVLKQWEFSTIAAKINHFRATQLEALRQADHLFQTLLHQAFSSHS